MKREMNGDEQDSSPNKRYRRNDEVVRILIPSKIAGAIIGKGGQHINRLRSEYKATINVEDCQGPERTIYISAEFENAISIIKEMLQNFDEKNGEYDLRMLIHQSLAGCVIGKGGSKIKEIRDKIGCCILKVFSNVAPQSSDRVVQCIGKLEQCVDSVREILELVKPMPIKGPVQNYDPINFDDLYADEYGGFGVGGGGRGGGGGGGNNTGGSGNGYRGGNNNNSSDRFDRGNGGGGGGGGGGRGGDRFNDRRGGGGNDRRGGGNNDRRGGNNGGSGGNNNSRGGGNMRDRDFIDPWAPNAGPMSNSVGGGNMGNFGPGNGMGNGMGNGGGMGGGNNGMGLGGMGGMPSPLGGNNMGGGGGGGVGGLGAVVGGGMGGMGNMGGMGVGNLGSGNMGGGNGGNFGSGNNGNVGGGGGGGAIGMNNMDNDGKNTTQVTIPKDLAGAIIGKAGSRIRRIRMESNAFITIDEPLPGSTDRIITITGTQKQIQMAQYLLQQSVHEHRRKF